MASTETLEKKMRQIRALLSRADHPQTPPAEADSARVKAELLMNQYRIEESELAERGGAFAIMPVVREVPLCPLDSTYNTVYRYLMAYVASHVGVRAASDYRFNLSDEFPGTTVVAVCVGYESDLRYGEFLYQSARAVFADRMEPRPDPHLTDADNVYRMRNAGMERIRIAERMGWVKGGAKVTRLYKQACAERGEDPVLTGKGIDVKAFRDEYASSFLNEFWMRLQAARNGADVQGGALVLANRKENVDERFYELYPHMRPSAVPATTTKAPRKVREHRWTKADERAYQRSQSSAGEAGKAAGRAAAKDVHIKPDQPQAKRLSE